MKTLYSTFLLLFFSVIIYGQGENELCLPRANTSEIITHYGYYLSYNEQHEQANWVAYELTSAETNRVVERSNSFRVDAAVTTGTATAADYKGSGFDRGHLAPAADMSWSARAEAESFYYSNMTPQRPGFNRGIWRSLEALIRNWAVENGALLIATGPILTDDLSKIGYYNAVSVPDYYWKVVIDYSMPELKGIGFILPNQKGEHSLQYYVQPIDNIEKITGFDFFHLLPDSIENVMESTVSLEDWSWSPGHIISTNPTNTDVSVQCKGTTQSGSRCRNSTRNSSGYCHHHTHQSPSIEEKPAKRSVSVQCSGTTQAGNRCKRRTLSQNGRCYQHGGN